MRRDYAIIPPDRGYPVMLFRSRLASLMSHTIFLRVALFISLAVAAAGCNSATPPPPLEATDVGARTPTPTVEPTPTESLVRLGLWMPESLAPIGASRADALLRAQIAEFDDNQPEITLVVSAKKDRGPGGLLDLLRAASPVAPAALPDVILLSDADLAIAAREGLIQPLDESFDPQIESRLFPFARNAAYIDGKRMGVPLAVDFDHLALDVGQLNARLLAWPDVISATVPYLFSFSDAGHVSDGVLADYAALGGTIINAEGQPALTPEALTQLLTLYRDAKTAGVILPDSLDWTDLEMAWSAFRRGESPLVRVNASRYLAARASGSNLDFAPSLLVGDRAVSPIGRSWNLAVVTPDPRRTALAVALMAHLTEPDRSAAWTQARGILPARIDALEQWNLSASYATFARGELSRASPPPSPAALEAISPAFLAAIRDVLTGRASPPAAATSAVEAVARGGN